MSSSWCLHGVEEKSFRINCVGTMNACTMFPLLTYFSLDQTDIAIHSATLLLAWLKTALTFDLFHTAEMEKL